MVIILMVVLKEGLNKSRKYRSKRMDQKYAAWKRYRMLIHPQYYGRGELERFETDLDWYNKLF